MVLYFSGTGNSRYLARHIAEGLEMPLYDLNACIKAGNTAPVQTGRDVVLVTPTYAWRIPRVVSEWLGKTVLTGAERIWFVMDCGSEIGNAAGYNRQLAAQSSCSIWARPKLSCRKTTLPCSMHPGRSRHGASWSRQSLRFRRCWRSSRPGRNFLRRERTSTTAL